MICEAFIVAKRGSPHRILSAALGNGFAFVTCSLKSYNFFSYKIWGLFVLRENRFVTQMT